MTAQASIPLKWYVPFAQGDSSRVELPVTTSDPTRASQTLGFPPLTMQPPESGGVPPQGEDFNGGMNQVARIAWWVLNGGGWPYDATFATNPAINGYPNGAKLQSADLLGDWISIADNNQNNPDTSGASWVPGFQYGSTALTGLTGGTVTPSPAQAAKGAISLTGTLGSALTVVLPNWTKNWSITNNTTGAFVTIVKTAAGSGVTIPQNGAPTRVAGDGTNITQTAENVATATTTTQVAAAGQIAGSPGTLLRGAAQLLTAGKSYTMTGDSCVVATSNAATGIRYKVPAFSATINTATVGAGGMLTGSPAVSAGISVYLFYNPLTGAVALGAVNDTGATVPPSVYTGANIPAGYTANALVAAFINDGAGNFPTFIQTDRMIGTVSTNALTGAGVVTLQSMTWAAVPNAANTVRGIMTTTSTNASVSTATMFPFSSGGPGAISQNLNVTAAGGGGIQTPFTGMPIAAATPRTSWVTTTATGTASFTITSTGYTI